ncbi:hypothetical protein HY310_02770 [Candidatus Microgenomates bacterium]|nr:hypothetical protein [Candidatus Microgenomates bacterium]
MGKLILIDGHAILHRAYHALPPLTNRNGEQTNAVYGFVTMMLRILETHKPTNLIVAFDLPQPTFRQQKYTAYQAKRPEMQSNLAEQIPLLHSLLDAMNISYFSVSGYEADDVIGTLAAQSDCETVIVTGDRDMLQLVNDHVKVCVPVKGLSETKMYDPDVIVGEFGVAPTQWVDVKALKGDASDNYSGVPGIGPKTAEKLIKQFGTLENLYGKLGQLGKSDPRVAKKLAEGAESAGLAQQLAKIVTDVPVKLDLETSAVEKIKWGEGVKFMREALGFKSIADKIEKNYLKITPPEDPQLKLI